MRRVAIAVLAACGSSSSPSPPAESPPAPKPVASPADAAVPVAKPSPAFRVAAPPGGEIAFVAATPDGGAALVADETNGYRLYAALDASQEPVWVELPAAFAFAVIRDGDGFVAALLDDGGGLVIAAIDRDGRVGHHSELAGPFASVAAAEHGFVATKDHAVAVVDTTAVVHELAAPDDDPLGAISVAKDRAAVVVETKKGKRVRRLALTPPAWTGWMADGLAAIALSPSGERLAGIAGDKAVVVDAGTGRQLAARPATADSHVGFSDDGHVAIAGPGTSLTWLAVDPKESAAPATRPAGSAREPAVLATGGGHAITRVGSDLAIATPTEIRYLGYRIANAMKVEPAGADKLLVGGSDWAILDGKLAVIATPKIWAPAGQDVGNLQHVGGDDWLVGTLGSKGAATCLDDLAAGTGSIVRSAMVAASVEPSSRLVIAQAAAGGVEIYRHAPDRHALDKIGALPKSGSAFYYAVSTKLSGGVEIVAAEPRCETGCKLRWFRDLAHLDRSVDLDTRGYVLAAIDRAGHVFAYQDEAGTRQLAVYADGKLHATRMYGDRTVIPDPSGQRFLALTATTLALASLDGPELWSRPISAGQIPIWLDDGELVVASQQGIVRLDPATGEPIVARCGWRFELAAQPAETALAGESPCISFAPKRDVIAIPGDIAFQRLARDVASKSSAEIYEWGSYPIAGRLHRAATIVRGDDLVGFLVEVAPNKIVDLVFRSWGGTEYQRPAGSELRWTVGRHAAIAATATYTSAYGDDGIVFHMRWSHGSNESIEITLRGTTPVVAGSSWVERENVHNGKIEETHGGKPFATLATSCAECPPLATFKPHASMVTVRGPSANADDLLVAPDPAWEP